MSGPPPGKKMGFSLYADFLDPERKKAATISSAPIKYEMVKKVEADEAAMQKKKDASLKFQPIKRPQVQQKPNKPRAPSSYSSSSVMHKPSSSIATNTTTSASSPMKQQIPSSISHQQQPPGVQRSNYEDWVGGDEDDGYYFEGPKRERGGGKKKKNKKKYQQETRVWEWDDVYDPTLPNNYADYKGSEEQMREIRDWKARLYYHQLKEAKQQGKHGAGYSDEGEEEERARPMNSMFAPPSSDLNFAPPIFDNDPPPRPSMDGDNGVNYSLPEDDDDYSPEPRLLSGEGAYEQRPAFSQPSTTYNDASGEHAYLRRTQMSEVVANRGEPASAPLPPPPLPVANKPEDPDVEAKRAAAQAKIAAFKAKLQKPSAKPDAPQTGVSPPAVTTQIPAVPAAYSPPAPSPEPGPAQQPSGMISRAPVRYNVPSPPPDKPAVDDATMNVESDANIPRANPKLGKKGFAERLLKKYGWEKGQGLGAQGEGIATPIIAQAEKRKKLPDAKGGGWAQPANMGKIVGGKRRKVDNTSEGASGGGDDARLGKMSAVVKVEGMLRGVDVRREIEEDNLLQRLGEEMETRHGNVERVFVWGEESGGGNEVFIKFTSELGALRAVNAVGGVGFEGLGTGEGVVARFFDGDVFERGEFRG